MGSGAFRRGRDRDRNLGGAFRYSRRDLRLRRRGAYGIHRASGPMDVKGCVARLHPTGKTTHYDLCVAGAPANHVRCASLRSGGRRLAVRTAMGNHIGAMPRTPFPASRDFPSRGNERYEGKTASHILQVPFRRFPPLVAGATTFPPQAGALWMLSHGAMSLQESIEIYSAP